MSEIFRLYGSIFVNNDEANKSISKTGEEAEKSGEALVKTGEQAQKSAESIEKTGQEAEKSGGILSKLGGIAKAAGAVIGSAMGAAALAAGAAAVKLGKEVITAYADYEQLVGGVDTLFGEASQAVQGYAANAFKTAGMSANEYMETVTGFSASLIQSLGGDTEKAAEVADMAITDMADNANKMGSSMDSIQKAYQGFAKQNFGMLDNLKLGYGGTKTEMERLLADAEKISGIKYDLSSFSDLTEAIHVIQTEMGITGTTAKEAAETISGSMAGMNSAIQNLMAGFGNANADIGLLVGNVVEAFQNVMKNVMPVIENIVKALPPALDGILQAVGDLLPTLLSTVTELFSQVLTTILELLPELIPAAVDAVMTIVGALVDNLPLLIDAAIQLVTSLVKGIGEALPQLIPAAVNAVTTIVQGLVDSLPMLLDAALQLVAGLAEGIIYSIPVLLKELPKIIDSIVDFIMQSIPEIIDAGMSLFTALIGNIQGIIQDILQAVPQIINAVVNAIVTNIPIIIQAGIDLFSSLVSALPEIINSIVSALPQIISSVVAGLLQGIPTLILAGIQLFTALVEALPEIILTIVNKIPEIIMGIVNGFLSGKSQMKETGSSLLQSLWEGIKNYYSTLFESVKSLFGGLVDGIKDFFGLASGKNTMNEAGAQFGNSFVDGMTTTIDGKIYGVANSVRRVNNVVTDGISSLGEQIDITANRSFSELDNAMHRSGLAAADFRECINLLEAEWDRTWDALANNPAAEALHEQLRKGTISFEEFQQKISLTYPAVEEVSESLSRLGYTMDDIQNGTDMQEVFADVIRRLKQIPDEAERSQIAIELFGKQSAEKMRLLGWSIENDIIESFDMLPGKISEIGTNVPDNLWKGITSTEGETKSKSQDYVTDFVLGFQKTLEDADPAKAFIQMGINIAEGFAESISNGRFFVKYTMWEIATLINNGSEDVLRIFKYFAQDTYRYFKEMAENMKYLGGQVMDGFGIGAETRGKQVFGRIIDMFRSLIRDVNGIYGVRSPSRVFAEIGEYVDEGFAGGILNKAPVIDRAMDKVFGGLDRDVNVDVRSAAGLTGMQGLSSGQTVLSGRGETYHYTINMDVRADEISSIQRIIEMVENAGHTRIKIGGAAAWEQP